MNSFSEHYGVSVIIPAYNYADYLPAAIDSVLAQDYKLLECIIVDDGSTDDTRAVVSVYSKAVRYIYQENMGLSASRNTGISNATYPFVAFLDADDCWKPNMLSTAMQAYARLPEDFVLVACDNDDIDCEGRIISAPSRQQGSDRGEEIAAAAIVLKTRFCADAVVAKKEIIVACGGFDTSLRSTEDRDMWIRMSACGRIHKIPARLLQVRVHAGSMSTDTARMKRNGRKVLKKAFQAGVVSRWRVAFWCRVFSFHFFQCAWMYHDEGKSRNAVADMLKSIIVWPFFLHPQQLQEPLLFRLRALRRFFSASWRCRQPSDYR